MEQRWQELSERRLYGRPFGRLCPNGRQPRDTLYLEAVAGDDQGREDGGLTLWSKDHED